MDKGVGPGVQHGTHALFVPAGHGTGQGTLAQLIALVNETAAEGSATVHQEQREDVTVALAGRMHESGAVD